MLKEYSFLTSRAHEAFTVRQRVVGVKKKIYENGDKNIYTPQHNRWSRANGINKV